MPEGDTAITELEELIAEKVSGVASPANGTPFLVLKATEEVEPSTPFAPPAEGDPGQPILVEQAKPEPLSDVDQLTKEALDEILAKFDWDTGGAMCLDDECEICPAALGPLYPELRKKKLTAADRKKIPKGSFAIPEKAPGSGSYPIHDRSHAGNALSRSSGKPVAARVRAAVRRKYPDMGQKSAGVPDYSVATPKARGQITRPGGGKSSMSGKGPTMTGGVKPAPATAADVLGGESPYAIPADHIGGNPPVPSSDWDHPAQKDELIEIVEDEVTVKDAWMATDNPMMTDQPGSPSWEELDGATLDSVARGLAAAAKAVDAIMKREVLEAISGDPSDWFDAQKLCCAKEDICCALACIAALAYQEYAEASKEALSDETRAFLKDALPRLTALSAEITAAVGGPDSQEGSMQLTKDDLMAGIAGAVTLALKEDRKAEAKKQKKAFGGKQAKPFGKKGDDDDGETAKESVVEAGHVDEGDLHGAVRGTHDADDIGGAVPHSVESQYINKADKNEAKALRKQVAALSEQIANLGRPRSGGPVLDGVMRGASASASPVENLAKEVDASAQRIESLKKQVERAEQGRDPSVLDNLHQQLTRERLYRAHLTGEVV